MTGAGVNNGCRMQHGICWQLLCITAGKNIKCYFISGLMQLFIKSSYLHNKSKTCFEFIIVTQL